MSEERKDSTSQPEERGGNSQGESSSRGLRVPRPDPKVTVVAPSQDGQPERGGDSSESAQPPPPEPKQADEGDKSS